MKTRIVIVFFIFLLANGCNTGNYQGQMDTPLEFSQYTQPVVTDYEYEKLVSFLYEAEIMMHKPIEEATMTDEGIKVFPHPIKTKDDLFHYYQTYLSDELAETMARKLSDLSKSIEAEFLALSNTDIDWYSIYDAEPTSIKIVQHTTVQSVIEMDLKANPNTRLQYTIMKNGLGENPKIVQKTVLYD